MKKGSWANGLIGGGITSLLVLPLIVALLTLNGAASGQLPFPDLSEDNQPSQTENNGDDISSSDAEPARFPLNPEIDWTVFYQILAGLLTASMVIFGVMALRRPKFGPDYHAPIADLDPSNQFEQFITQLRSVSDPSQAIRLSFAAAETKIEHLPDRVQPETPFEWSRRVSHQQPHLHEALDRLCNLYALARFAPERTTHTQQQAAIAALTQLKYQSDSVIVPVNPLPVLPWS